jgi:hypothetical protein
MHYNLQDFIKNNKMILIDQHDEFFNKKNLARDGLHYNLAVATKFVESIVPLLI